MSITVKELKEMVSDKKGLAESRSRINRFRTLRTNQKNDQKFLDLKYDVEIHDEFKKIKLPTARQMVDTFVAHLPLSNPLVEVIPFKETKPYKQKAENLAKYFDALLRWNMQQTVNQVRQAAQDIGARGEAFMKVVWDENVLGAAVGEKDTDKRQALILEKMPLKILCRESMNCYPHPDHIDCRPADMIEIYTVLAEQVKRIWPKWKTNKSDTAPVVFSEYWSPEQVCFMADGTPVTDDIEKNDYGCTPYVHVYSGYGYRDADNSPESLAVSLFRHSIDLLKQQTRYFSYHEKATAFAALPMLDVPGTQEEWEEGGRKLVPRPGQVHFRGDRPGEEPAKVVWAAPNLPAGIMQAIGFIDAMLAKVQPSVLRGEPPKGIEAGYPMSLMIGEARLQFGIPLENLQTLLSRTLELVRLLVRDVIKEDVPIWGEAGAITLNKEDCEGAFRVNVKFDATTPEAAANRALILQRLRQGGDLSLETALELNPMIKNSRKELRRIRAESIAKHPALERRAAVQAVRELDGEQEAMAIQQAMIEGEQGALRKAESSGVPVGGEGESELPEDILAAALSKRHKAMAGEVKVEE